jgi:hypothetical protein
MAVPWRQEMARRWEGGGGWVMMGNKEREREQTLGWGWVHRVDKGWPKKCLAAERAGCAASVGRAGGAPGISMA